MTIIIDPQANEEYCTCKTVEKFYVPEDVELTSHPYKNFYCAKCRKPLTEDKAIRVILEARQYYCEELIHIYEKGSLPPIKKQQLKQKYLDAKAALPKIRHQLKNT